MYINANRHPLLHSITNGAEWRTKDEFPAAPEWADVHERWLEFVEAKGELARFLPRLKKSAYQRDRTFSEIGIAFYLENNRFLAIIDWEPSGNGGKRASKWCRDQQAPSSSKSIMGSTPSR